MKYDKVETLMTGEQRHWTSGSDYYLTCCKSRMQIDAIIFSWRRLTNPNSIWLLVIFSTSNLMLPRYSLIKTILYLEILILFSLFNSNYHRPFSFVNKGTFCRLFIKHQQFTGQNLFYNSYIPVFYNHVGNQVAKCKHFTTQVKWLWNICPVI